MEALMAFINRSYKRKRNDRYEEEGLQAIGSHLDKYGIKVISSQVFGSLADMDPEDAVVVAGGILSGANKPKQSTVMVAAQIIRPKGSKESFEVADPDMASKLIDAGGEYMGEKMVERQIVSGDTS